MSLFRSIFSLKRPLAPKVRRPVVLRLEYLEGRITPNVSFTPETILDLPSGASPQSIAVADFNHDGIPDLAVADSSTNQVTVFFGTGGGAFTAGVSLSTVSGGVGMMPNGIAAADVNNDGIPDIVTANGDGSITTLLSNGNGTFKAPIATSTGLGLIGPSFVGIAVGDFNNDGIKDVVVTSGGTNGVGFEYGNNTGVFGDNVKGFSTFTRFGTNPDVVTTANFNGLGTGAAVTNRGGGDVSVFLNSGAHSNFAISYSANYAAGTNPTGVAAGDFNNDGRPDLAVANFNTSGTVNVLLNNGDGTFGAATPYAVGNSPLGIATADFNLDGSTDIVTANQGASNDISELQGNGNGTFQAVASISPGDGAAPMPQSIAAADFNSDARPDLASLDIGTDQVSVLLNTTALPATAGGNVVVNGTSGNDTLVVNATNANSGSYSLNGGPAVSFAGVSSFTFNGLAGVDTFTVNNPAGGLFAPSGGVFYDGGGQTGDNLQVLGGTATTSTYTYNPDTAEGHNGSIAFVNGAVTANYSYQGLSPISSTVTSASVVFNLPAGDGDNQAILQDDGVPNNGVSEITSGNGSFETTQFTNPTTTLMVNDSNDGETVTVNMLDAASPPPTIDLNGGAGNDTFAVTPSTGSTFDVDGNLPDPPTSPGDALNVTIPVGSNPVLTSSATPIGFTGNYAFSSGGYQPVYFVRIETLNPPSADLAITNTGPATADAGANVTYTLSVTNNGPADAQSVSVTDTLPAGETFVSASEGSGAGTSFVDPIGAFAAGASTTITIVATISPTATNGATETDTASVASGNTPDPNAANNTATFNTTVNASADLAVTKTGPATANAGALVTYTLSVTNNGPIDAQNVMVTDTLPADETFVSASAGSGAGTSFVDLVGALAAGASDTIDLVAQISPAVANGATETDTATVASTTPDSNSANNTATTDTTVNNSADVSIAETGPASVNAGANVTYDITTTNAGPVDAQSVTTSDVLPAHTTLVSFVQNTGPANGGTLPAGQTQTFTLVLTVDASTPDATVLTNTANVSSSSPIDPNSANNSSSVNTTVNNTADVSVTETGPATVNAGDNVTYTITTTNNGPLTAQGVTTSDALPANTTLVSFTQDSGPANGDPLAAGGTQTFTLVLTVNANTPDATVLTNTANVSSSSPIDPNSANNSSSVNTTVNNEADVAVTNTDNQTIAHPGLPVTYTIVVSNSGPSDATNATVTDAFPSDLNNVTFTTTETGGANGFTPSGNGNIHDTVNVPLGATITYIATGTVDSSATSGILSNTAAVEPSGAASDPNTANNSATDDDALAPLSGAVVVNGTAGSETVVVTAADPDSGSYTVNGGPAVPFSDVTSFTFNGGPGDSLIVHNPAGGLFAPSGGVIYNGGSGANSLQILDGFAAIQIFTFSPNSAGGGHNGSIAFVNGATTANYTYSNLTPVLVNAGTPNAVVFNLPNDGQDDMAVVQASGSMSEIVSQVGAFETTTFVNPSASLTINVPGATAETLTLGAITGSGVIPTIVLNGGPGADTFNIQGTPFTGTAVVVNGGSGPDTFNVQGESGALVTINGGTASNVLNYDARGQSIGTGAGAIAFNGRPAVLYANIGTLNLNNAASVETIAGPDTADRSTAFTGLSAQERFVQALYLDELGRAGTQAELDGWVSVLNGPGGAQAVVASDILHSQEARDHLVKSWYVTFLGRQADGTEELGFVNQLLQGGTEEQVLSEILGSAEFDDRAQTLISTGTRQQRDVQALYELLLNRTGESLGVAGYVNALRQIGLQGVAQDFLTSTEFRGDLFEGYYNALLHRPSDQAISNAVFSNLDAAAIRIIFEGSAEFFTNG